MLFNSYEFKVMEQSADALWQKQKVISQNIANYDTPGYKSKVLSFSEVLSSVDAAETGKVIDVYVYEESDTASRPDGNNVDLISENLDLYKTYMQSTYLYEKISNKFSSIQNVLSSMPR